MGEFKKGDFVRRTSGSSLHTSSGHHEAGFVGQVSDVKFRGGTNDIIFTNGHEGIAQNYEPWQPRVGERVRYSGKSKCYSEKELVGLEGVVTETGDRQAVVKWDKAIVDGIRTGGAKYIENIEPILSTTTPEQPATLKIEAGKFYKTRDGRKVGPMRDTGGTSDHWTTTKTEIGLPYWHDDGAHWSGRTNPADLIAEWIDEPAAKARTATASNDNTQPKFNVGDVVKRSNGFMPHQRLRITKVDGDRYSVEWLVGGPGSIDTWRGYEFELVTPAATPTTTTTTIVALIENGQPKPSSTPHVHTSTGAAEKEAKRLAGKYKGQQFGVFTLTTTHEEAAPVYDHKWQNLAALGLKIDAIKELRSITGMGLKPAKDAVEYFLAA